MADRLCAPGLSKGRRGLLAAVPPAAAFAPFAAWFLFLAGPGLLTAGAQDQPNRPLWTEAWLEELPPVFQPFTDLAAVQKQAEEAPAILWFAAEWCGLCRAAKAEFRARAPELPRDLRVYLVDFDRASELRARYRIPLQDVFVQIGPEGERRALWVGGAVRSLKERPLRP